MKQSVEDNNWKVPEGWSVCTVRIRFLSVNTALLLLL